MKHCQAISRTNPSPYTTRHHFYLLASSYIKRFSSSILFPLSPKRKWIIVCGMRIHRSRIQLGSLLTSSAWLPHDRRSEAYEEVTRHDELQVPERMKQALRRFHDVYLGFDRDKALHEGAKAG